jgi:hypothetical protein
MSNINRIPVKTTRESSAQDTLIAKISLADLCRTRVNTGMLLHKANTKSAPIAKWSDG